MTSQSAADHYQLQQRITVTALRALRLLWTRVDRRDFDGSWSRVRLAAVQVVSAAQFGAARSSAGYLDRVLAETGQRADRVASGAVDARSEVIPDALAGSTLGGGDLGELLDLSVVRTKVALAPLPDGAPGRYGVPLPGVAPQQAREDEALFAGLRFLEEVSRTEIADAERAATQVGMVIRPKIVGYIRVVNLPCCSRCAILAGRWYGWNDGFERHPGCDCRHEPAPQSRSTAVKAVPERIFKAGMVTGLSTADRQAIEDGANIGQVVNARRGISADGLWTREGTTRRGYASGVGAGRRGARPTVNQIYRHAESREDAITILRASGYVT